VDRRHSGDAGSGGPLHTSLAFESTHFAVTRMRGRFRRGEGVITIAERPEDSSVYVTIDAASIDTNHPKADENLRGEHFLDAERFPHLRFRSTSVRHRDGSDWAVTGELTIRDVTRPITLDVTFNGALPFLPKATAKLGFTATARFDRRDFGIDWNVPIPTGGVVVGNDVKILLDVEADLPLG
jgi:polyisoprenoid-binding protein YceI